MRNDERHPTQQELLLFLDDEMATDEAFFTESHLSQCENCSTALRELTSVLEQVSELNQSGLPEKQTHEAQRSLLRMRLRQEAPPRSGRWSPMQQPVIYGAAALLLCALSITWAHHQAMQESPMLVQDRPVPNPELTPGTVRDVNLDEICPAKDDDKDPAVPAELQRVVFEEYGVAKPTRAREFQVDYLINPQLGGTGELRNLWPQPYDSTAWNAHAKDALEDRLHEMVCERQIDLAEAQREIATDWIGAYKKHFHTEMPLRETTALAQSASAEYPEFSKARSRLPSPGSSDAQPSRSAHRH